MKLLVDTFLQESMSEGEMKTGAVYYAIAYFILRQLAVVFGNGKDYSYEHVQQSVAREFSTRTFEKLQTQSFAFHLARSAGVNSSLLGRGTAAVTVLLDILCLNLGPTLLEASLVVAAFYNLGAPRIAVIVAVTTFVHMSFTSYSTKRRVALNRDLVKVTNNLSKHAVETLGQFDTVKMFASERREIQKGYSLRESIELVSNNSNWLSSSIGGVGGFICHAGITVGMFVAASEASAGRITAGDFIMTQNLMSQLFTPVIWLGNSYGRVVDSLTCLEDVMDVYEMAVSVEDTQDAIVLRKDEAAIERGEFGEIEFDRVSFSYDRGELTGEESSPSFGGLSNISFRVPAGSTVALVGHSGSGKSTTMRLLLRLYDVDSGAIRFNGVDVRHYTQESLRACIGVVAQDTIMFDDTIRYNVSYGTPEATDLEVWRAIRAAALEPYVTRQPLGLDTIVGPRGVTMSGGERQRAGIARCILKNPAVQLLDEPSSSLDTTTERLIQDNIAALCRNRTTFTSAHRLSTIMDSDQILVFAHGRIVERGTHEELVQMGGVYAEMWIGQGGNSS